MRLGTHHTPPKKFKYFPTLKSAYPQKSPKTISQIFHHKEETMTKEEARAKFNEDISRDQEEWTDKERAEAFQQDMQNAIAALGLEPNEDGTYSITLADIHGLLD